MNWNSFFPWSLVYVLWQWPSWRSVLHWAHFPVIIVSSLVLFFPSSCFDNLKPINQSTLKELRRLMHDCGSTQGDRDETSLARLSVRTGKTGKRLSWQARRSWNDFMTNNSRALWSCAAPWSLIFVARMPGLPLPCLYGDQNPCSLSGSSWCSWRRSSGMLLVQLEIVPTSNHPPKKPWIVSLTFLLM